MVIQGDCLDILPTLPEKSVQCCVTSPPYWGLRDYGVDGQLGLEKTPEEYVANMVKVFREVKRVLRDDGTLWLNLGDSYYNYRTGYNGALNKQSFHKGDNGKPTDHEVGCARRGLKQEGLKEKDLVGIPWRVAFALQSDGWWLRQDIIWNKPNPMPESVTDRCTKSHEYIFLLTKSAKYFYDAEAIKEPQKECTTERYKYGWDGVDDDGSNGARTGSAYKKMKAGMNMGEAMGGNGMRNKRSVWEITTKPFKEAHFATFPPEIPEICIKAGSRVGDSVLDPFSGAGTTGLVAEELNRNYIGIELNPDYVSITAKRMYGLQPNLIF
jgi:DNA modification methylase